MFLGEANICPHPEKHLLGARDKNLHLCCWVCKGHPVQADPAVTSSRLALLGTQVHHSQKGVEVRGSAFEEPWG